jgi:membrane protease YdiL (CAAX protease family)
MRYLGTSGKPLATFLPWPVASLVFLGAALVLLHKRWELEKQGFRLIVLLICFYAGMALGTWTEHQAGRAPEGFTSDQMLVGMLSFQGAALIIIHCFVRDHQASWGEAFGLNNDWQRALLLGLIAATLFLPVGMGLLEACNRALTYLPNFPIQPHEQVAVQTLRKAASWPARTALGAFTILMVPAAEELLFRGILYPWIKQAGFPRLALWGTAVVFALMHFNVGSFLPLLLLALLLTVLYERTNNLLAPIAAHSLFNAVNFVMIFLARQNSG